MSSLSNSKVTLVDHEGDSVKVSDTGNLMVDIGAASISGDLSVNLTQADKVSIWGNEQADGEGTARAVLVDSGGRLQVDVIDISLGTVQVQSNSANLATSSGQLAAGHTIDCNSTFVKLKDGSGTALTSDSGKLDIALHAADGTAITESSGQLDVNIAGAGTSVTVAQASSARTIVGTVTVDLGSNNDVTVTSGNVGHDITGMAQGTTTVGTSAMQLDEGTDGYSVACKRIDLTSRYTNTGDIYVGSADTISANPVSIVGGVRLSAGDFYSIDINNLTHIWVEASQADQELDFIYYT